MSTTYINSKVSLISKSMIRYEGTLFSINAEEATITLSNVKSFGTEARKADKFIPPRDAIFEYIIFKATDIKDLIVDEPLVNEFNDPAILQAHTSLSTNTSVTNDNKSLSLNGINGQSNVFNGNQSSNLTNVQSAGQTDRFGFRSRVSTPSSSQPRSPVSEVSSQKPKSDKQIGQKSLQQQSNSNTNNNFNRNNNNNSNNHYNNRRKLDNQSNYNNNNQRFDSRQNRPYLNNHNFNNNNRRQMNYYPNNNKYPNNNSNRSGQNYHRNDDLSNTRFGNNNLSNRNNGLRKPRIFNNNNNNNSNNNNNISNNNKGARKFDPKLKTEFDFEKANQVFQQMVDKLNNLDVNCNDDKNENKDENKEDGKTSISNKEEENNFYDKRKSFFDNISCEAIERSKGKKNRFDWKQERKLNAETFGLQINYRRTDYNQGYRTRINYNNNRNKFTSGNLRQPRTNSS